MSSDQSESRSRTISVTMVHEVEITGDVHREEVVTRLGQKLDGLDIIVEANRFATIERSHEAKGGSVRREG